MKLTTNNVEALFTKCLFEKGETPEPHVVGEGVLTLAHFHPGRLKESEADIASMCDELHPNFHKDSGGGFSFLNLCEDKNGRQWADLHITMDKLVALGMATGKLSYFLPRPMWSSLPGGMPYIIVN